MLPAPSPIPPVLGAQHPFQGTNCTLRPSLLPFPWSEPMNVSSSRSWAPWGPGNPTGGIPKQEEFLNGMAEVPSSCRLCPPKDVGRSRSGTGHTKTHLHRDTKHPFRTKHHFFSGEKDGKEISQYQKEILMQKLKGELALSWLSKNRTGNCKWHRRGGLYD